MRKTIISWLLVTSWMAIIFLLSHQPSDASSKLSGGLTNWLISFWQAVPFHIDVAYVHFIVRKLAHLTAYFILGILMLRAAKRHFSKGLHVIWLSFILCVLYAMSDELHQLFIPGRSGEIRDVIIDSIGALLGISTYFVGSKLVTTSNNKRS